MLNITLITIGSLKEQYLKDAMAEYQKRLGAYCTFREINLKEEKTSGRESKASISEALEKEADDIIKIIPPKSYKIALVIEGKMLSSEELAEKISSVATSGYSEIAFIIGSSCGLSPRIKALADLSLSFSRMTFPHQLMRIILCEQIYRAMNIISGGKYHK